MDHRSPLESIFSVIGSLPQGHDKPVKHALYNAVALLLLFVCCAAGYAVYMILEPFIKPLIWAVLVGSALHPLKRSLSYRFRMWFKTLEITKTPVVLGIVLLPINIVDGISEFLCKNIWKRLKIIIALIMLIVVIHLMYYYTPKVIISITWQIMINVWILLNFFLDSSTLSTVVFVVLGYSTLLFFLWKPENSLKFHYASILVWVICLSCLASQFGSFRVPVFILLQVVVFGGFVSEVYTIYQLMNDSGHPLSITKALSFAFYDHRSNKIISSKDPLQDLLNINLKDDTETTERIKSSPLAKKNVDGSKENDPWSLDLFKSENESNRKETSSQGAKTSIVEHSIQQSVVKQIKPETITDLKRSLSHPQLVSSKPDEKFLPKLNRRLSEKLSSAGLLATEKYESTFYLFSVLWACIIMILWKNTMLLLLLPIPIIYYIVKHLGLYIGLWNYLEDKYRIVFEVMNIWCQERHEALVPVPIRGLYHVAHKFNVMMKIVISNSIDTVSSCVVIFGLIIFLICASVFIAVQIYAEGIMLIQMTGNVINQTVVQNPELRQLLPPAWDDTMDSILDNAYQYGREGLSKLVNGMMTGVDSAKSEKLEKQVLELWDRIYQNWMSTNDCNGPKVTEDAVWKSWEYFWKDIQKTPEMFHLDSLMEFGGQHFGTLMSLLESVWSILKGNITLILGSLSTFLSVILGGGSAVLNFILNVVVFLTTLFYLLNSSGDLYKPVEMLTNFSSSGRIFGHALEEAINGVFSASFKMAAFYGMWTWFIHNLFGVKIVYLPTAFATILGGVPFLGTYWACIPAVLDLWLVEDSKVIAVIFAIFQFIPTSVVDTTIYKEIKGGGHPYLTGLAIAGGIFCLGVEGAIMGPLILCGLYVAVNLSSSLLKDSQQSINLNERN